MADYAELLRRSDDWLDVVLSPQPFAAAVKAVLELHKPASEVNPEGVRYAACAHCGFGDDGWPCPTVKVIAAALGVTDG